MDAELFLIQRDDSSPHLSDASLLPTLDQAAASLLQQNLPEKALGYMDEAARVRRACYGDRSTEAITYCRSVVHKVVSLASKKLEKGDISTPLQMLVRLEALLAQFPVEVLVPEMCDVYNSLSYGFRKSGRLPTAKQYSLKALKMAGVYKEAGVDRAAIALNMSAVLDQLNLHKEALDYALRAVQAGQEELLEAGLTKKTESSRKVALLAVAYHNAGIQEERLSHYEAALDWYEKALKLVQQHGDDQNKSVLKRLEKTYNDAMMILRKKMDVTSAVPAVEIQRTQSASKSRPVLSPKMLSPIRPQIALMSPKFLQVYSHPRVPKPPLRFRKAVLPARIDLNSAVAARLKKRERTLSPGRGEKTDITGGNTSSARTSPRRDLKIPGHEEDIEDNLESTKIDPNLKGRRPIIRLKNRVGSPKAALGVANATPVVDAEHLPKLRDVSLRTKVEELSFNRSATPKHTGDTSSFVTSKTHTFILPLPLEDLTPLTPQTANVLSSLSSSSRPPSGLSHIKINAENEDWQEYEGRNEREMISPSRVRRNSEEFDGIISRNIGKRERKMSDSIAATKIQTKIRAFLARKRVKRMKAAAHQSPSRKLVYRASKTFRDSESGEVCIYKSTCDSGYTVIFAKSDSTVLESRFPALALPYLLSKLGLSTAGELCLVEEKPAASELRPITRIQAWVRGWLARRRVRMWKANKGRGRKVALRAGKKLSGRYALLSLISSPSGLSVLLDCEDLATPIPLSLSFLPHASILDMLHFRCEALQFHIPEKPASPPAPRDSSRPLLSFASLLSAPKQKQGVVALLGRKPVSIEIPPKEYPISPSSPCPSPRLPMDFQKLSESAKTDLRKSAVVIQSGLRMKRDKDRVRQLRQTYRKTVEKIGQTVGFLGQNRYLVTITREAKPDVIIKLEAYWLEPQSKRLKSTMYAEETIKSTYGWTDCLAHHSQELISDVDLAPGDTVSLRKLTDFPAFVEEASFDEQSNVLSPSKVISEAEASCSFTIPVITIFETTSENRISTLDPGPVRHSLSRTLQHRAATRIQTCYRRHKAKADVASLKVSHRACIAYRTFRLLPNSHSFSVEFSHPSADTTEIVGVDLHRYSRYSVLLSAEKDYTRMDYMEISHCLWTKPAGRLGVFVVESMTERHRGAAITISRVAKGWLSRLIYKQTYERTEKRMRGCVLKEFSGLKRGVAGYVYPMKVGVECFPIYKAGGEKERAILVFFSLKELKELFAGRIDMAEILADVLFEHDKLILKSKRLRLEAREQALLSSKIVVDSRSIMRTSRKLDDKMWVVTMSVIGAAENVLKPTANDIIEFSAFSSSQQTPLKVKTTVEELSHLTHLSAENIFPIGTLTIQKLLKVKDGALVIDENEQVPDVNELATFIQAHVRGFVTRRKTMHAKTEKSQLISCTIMPLDGSQWILYASREPPFIKLESVHRVTKVMLSTLISDNIFSRFPPTLSKKRIIDNFIFPKLHLVSESGTRHLRITQSMQLQQNMLEKYQGKIKVITSKVDTKMLSEEGVPVITVLQADLGELMGFKKRDETPPKPLLSDLSSDDYLPKLSVLPPVEESSPNSTLSLSFIRRSTLEDAPQKPAEKEADKYPTQQAPPNSFVSGHFTSRREYRKESCKETRKEPELKPVNRGNLVLRSGVEIDGMYYFASIFGDRKRLVMELTNSQTKEKGQGVWDVGTEEINDLDQYCGELLNRIRVKKAADGAMIVEVIHNRDVLYKKSHYISNRYCIVTVFSDHSGLTISAYDPEKLRTYDLPIGHRSQKSPEALQRDMSLLIKKLRIANVLGEEALSLAAE